MLHCPVCSGVLFSAWIVGDALRRRDTFTLDMLQIPQGAGSGFVWDDAGHVVCLAACCLHLKVCTYHRSALSSTALHCTALGAAGSNLHWVWRT